MIQIEDYTEFWNITGIGELVVFSSGTGAYRSLVNENNRIYTHHPVAVTLELLTDPRFRHLNYQVATLVREFGEHRVDSPLNPYWNFEVDPRRTKENVACKTGMMCFACNNFIFKPDEFLNFRDLEDYHWHGTPTHKWQRWVKANSNEQYWLGYLFGWDSKTPHLPTLCGGCLQIVNRFIDTKDIETSPYQALSILIKYHGGRSANRYKNLGNGRSDGGARQCKGRRPLVSKKGSQ